jgi:hypothetical protein
MGDKYDYSLTVYTTRKNKIKVIYDIVYEQLPIIIWYMHQRN